ncbi:hypothetical protein PAXRUDRAFT_827865 [Paxillus rubicundulus Ve08.2h10]|uniref:Uncharacterized protein n=1 Tax=Paxillus rubicundulus Ve08.2h10 TaxID=930991 RepID=A0A0D0E242_9AGAM|nr:hypothetical protein PAXRUDRAFT_827865 [Paxillus rubicundulus Ve08.2h10]
MARKEKRAESGDHLQNQASFQPDGFAIIQVPIAPVRLWGHRGFQELKCTRSSARRQGPNTQLARIPVIGMDEAAILSMTQIFELGTRMKSRHSEMFGTRLAT